MPKQKRNSKSQTARSDKTIQYSALAVIVIVIGAVVWNFAPKTQSPQASACSAFDSIASASKYEAPPPMLIDTSKKYFATIKMEKGGEIVFELYPDKAPVTVNSFVFLACKGFYDGITFHRVLEGFMAQTGDPTGTGAGGPGYSFKNEDSDLTFNKEGVVAMANSGRDTNGSQFFITFGPQDHLNGGYTIFGQVVSGMDVAKSITRRNPDENPPFQGDKIATIIVSQE